MGQQLLTATVIVGRVGSGRKNLVFCGGYDGHPDFLYLQQRLSYRTVYRRTMITP
jgi:hypothetical protein